MKDKDTATILWWGYKHTNGHYQVKRYFDSRDIKEARDSPFVVSVTEAFHAVSREDALKKTKEQLA